MTVAWLPFLFLTANETAVDLQHVTLQVVLEPTSIREVATLRASASTMPATWTLQLQPTMSVRAVTCHGKDVAHAVDGAELRLELASIERAADGAFELEIRADGAPAETFSKEHGGYVRSVISPDIAYIRSQVAWYPRAEDDACTYAITIEAPEAWQVRTAGALTDRAAANGRATWAFAQARPVRTVGLAAGPWVPLEKQAGDGALLDAFAFAGDEQGARALLDTAARAFAHYSKQFGDVPRARFTIVAMPEAFGSGSGYGEEGYILVGEGAFDVPDAPWAQDLIAHEVAHTWWGREVSFRDFTNETLATYAELRFAEADRGTDAARAKRRDAVEAVAAAAAEGRTIALADIEGWGGGMDPRTYTVHAYEKGAMLLSMVEDALGRAALDRVLAKFFVEHAGASVGWSELRATLVASSAKARALVERFEQPGIPTFTVEHETKPAGAKWRVDGAVVQEGEPLAVTVVVATVDGDEPIEKEVALKGARAKFQLTAPFEPSGIVVDPDYRLLVARSHPTIADPQALFSEAFEIVNSPAEDDEGRNEHAIALLRSLLRAGVAPNEGLCHGGIGRCLFRLGRLDEAQAELQEALRMLGNSQPFHRAWFHLRLGCIADLDGRRKEALEHYAQASGPGASDTTAERARRFSEKAYRGFEQDG